MEENLKLIEQLIADSSSKENISDGVLTLGELHSDRATLFITLISFLVKVYSLKDQTYTLWHSESEKDGFTHYGLELALDMENKVNIAGIFPTILESKFIKLGSKHLPSPKDYKSLNLTLKTFNF
jgi:hypothetical protein